MGTGASGHKAGGDAAPKDGMVAAPGNCALTPRVDAAGGAGALPRESRTARDGATLSDFERGGGGASGVDSCSRGGAAPRRWSLPPRGFEGDARSSLEEARGPAPGNIVKHVGWFECIICPTRLTTDIPSKAKASLRAAAARDTAGGGVAAARPQNAQLRPQVQPRRRRFSTGDPSLTGALAAAAVSTFGVVTRSRVLNAKTPASRYLT